MKSPVSDPARFYQLKIKEIIQEVNIFIILYDQR